jgi:hypothetical protein
MLESSVLLPVVHINIAYATNYQLEFTLVKWTEQLIRYQLAEAWNANQTFDQPSHSDIWREQTFLQSQELLFDSPHEPVVHVELHVLPLVVFSHGDLLPIRLQLMHLEYAEAVIFYAEGWLNDVRYVVFAAMYTND